MLNPLCRPSTEGTQTREQLREFERLHEVVVRPCIQSRHTILYRVTCRQHQDGTVIAAAAQACTRLDARLPRHHPIQDQDIVLRIGRILIDVTAVRHPLDRDIVLFEHILNELPEAQIIFRQKHTHRIISRRLYSTFS